MLIIFFAFAIFHALGDFPLQGEFLSRAKNRGADLSEFFGSNQPQGIWFHALTAHSLIHAGGVWLVSGSVILAGIELILHWVIDFVKSCDKTSFTVDQILHYACKMVYAILLVSFPSTFVV